MLNLIMQAPDAGVITGERLPNFARLDVQGTPRLFYDLCCGKGALIVLIPESGREEAVFFGHCRDFAACHDLVPVLLSPGSQEAGDEAWISLVDSDGALFRHFTGVAEAGAFRQRQVMLTDRTLRVIWRANDLPPALPPSWPVSPPVLQVPGLFSGEECRSLIEGFESGAQEISGSHSDRDGRMLMEYRPELKSRRDRHVEDGPLSDRIMMLIARRLGPELQQAFHFRPSGVERFKLACYDADDRGHFAVHRDNSTPDAKGRKFALTVNLNTGDYDGGGLVFPEYSAEPISPPAGGAVVFSCGLAHRVMPVTSGRRYVLITFFS